MNSDRAIEVNIAIMRAFVHLRKMIGSHEEFARQLAELEGRMGEHDEQIQMIFDAIRELMKPTDESSKKIGFEVSEKEAAYAR